jgi:hypothetical protein
MTQALAARLDAHQGWRAAALAGLAELERFLKESDLRDATCVARVAGLRQCLTGDRRKVAVVGEFSRGKSELINALLVSEHGRRILPATPGRTTMCPVEIGFEPGTPASVALLPIETRAQDATLAELRADPTRWTRFEIDGDDPAQVADLLAQVARTRRASRDEARLLGLWDDDPAGSNPPVDAEGRVEIPLWRHALVNLAHPLLRRGLTVLDTPGLNALGAEPELTLGLLPAAHALVFVLGADTGVTRTDLALWQDHLATRSVAHFVVLNKIDTLRDPLLDAAQVERQVRAQCERVAATLGVPASAVFALSAREALVARIEGDVAAWQRSGLPQFESALGARLQAEGSGLLQRLLDEGLADLRAAAAHRLSERRRQIAEQTLELRGLRGKSAARLRSARQRVASEAAEFEQCLTQIQALRSVLKRLLEQALAAVAGERLRGEVEQLHKQLRPAIFKLNARAVFAARCVRLRELLGEGRLRSEEIQTMLGAACARLNAQFGFALALPPPAALQHFADELALIEDSYAQYLGVTHTLRLAQPRFMEQFKRMLLSKLRVVFESAGAEIELWSRAALTQINAQVGERRAGFERREASIARVEKAAGELELRLAELAAQDAALQQQLRRLGGIVEALRDPLAARDVAMQDRTACRG